MRNLNSLKMLYKTSKEYNKLLRIENGGEFYGNEFEEFMWELWNIKEKD